MTGYHYFICDVFTKSRFGGNQLAVIPDARGLSEAQMQQIAREFNFSESTFVFPPEAGATRKVRIFTPSVEVPFAGHPNIGTAFVLTETVLREEFSNSSDIELCFEERAGRVPITIRRRSDDLPLIELEAPQSLQLGQTFEPHLLARALTLSDSDIVTKTHLPQLASVGLPFIMVEVCDLETLQRIKVQFDGFEIIEGLGVTPDIHVYVRDPDGETDLRCRMFAPFDGVLEDPATGSANAALVALLAQKAEAKNGVFSYRIKQGIEMGRPSELQGRARKSDSKVTHTWIAGHCVLIADGTLYLD